MSIIFDALVCLRNMLLTKIASSYLTEERKMFQKLVNITWQCFGKDSKHGSTYIRYNLPSTHLLLLFNILLTCVRKDCLKGILNNIMYFVWLAWARNLARVFLMDEIEFLNVPFCVRKEVRQVLRRQPIAFFFYKKIQNL